MGWELAVPGSVRAHVDELDAIAPTDSRWRPRLAGLGVTLQELRSRGEGTAVVVVDGLGETHEVALEKWGGVDPDTRLVIWFSYQQRNAPDGLRGSIYPNDVLARVSPAG